MPWAAAGAFWPPKILEKNPPPPPVLRAETPAAKALSFSTASACEGWDGSGR